MTAFNPQSGKAPPRTLKVLSQGGVVALAQRTAPDTDTSRFQFTIKERSSRLKPSVRGLRHNYTTVGLFELRWI